MRRRLAILLGGALLAAAPRGEGTCGIGTRINRRDYFKGAIFTARMTRRALAVGEFLKVPEGLRE